MLCRGILLRDKLRLYGWVGGQLWLYWHTVVPLNTVVGEERGESRGRLTGGKLQYTTIPTDVKIIAQHTQHTTRPASRRAGLQLQFRLIKHIMGSKTEERYLRDTLTVLQDNLPRKRRRLRVSEIAGEGEEDGVGHELIQEIRKERLAEMLPILISGSGPLAVNGSLAIESAEDVGVSTNGVDADDMIGPKALKEAGDDGGKLKGKDEENKGTGDDNDDSPAAKEKSKTDEECKVVEEKSSSSEDEEMIDTGKKEGKDDEVKTEGKADSGHNDVDADADANKQKKTSKSEEQSRSMRYKLKLALLKKENEEFDKSATDMFRNYAGLLSAYRYGLKHVSELKDLTAAPDNILAGNFPRSNIS